MGTHSPRSVDARNEAEHLRDGPSAARVFWTFWSAGTVSNVGSAVTAVALPLAAVSVLDASAFEVSALAAASYVAWIVIGLPAGVIVQRLPLRETQVVMDLARALALASVPLVWWWGHLALPQLVLVALVVGFATVIFDVGNMTMLPTLVSKEELTGRNSLMSGTHATVQVGGPSMGGLLVQLLGSVPTLILDVASYLVSALLMGRLPRREVARPETPSPMLTMIGEGWRFVTRHPVMGPCMWAATVVNFANGALLALIPVYLVRELGASPGLVGLLIASDGVGTLLGATYVPRLSRRVGTARAIMLASLAGGTLALFIPAGHDAVGMALFAIGNGGFAAGVVVFSVNTRTYRQTASPPELLSRVMATVRFVSWGAIPAGSLVAGAVATWLGVRPALWLTCAWVFLPVLVLARSPVRRLRDLDDWEQTSVTL